MFVDSPIGSLTLLLIRSFCNTIPHNLQQPFDTAHQMIDDGNPIGALPGATDADAAAAAHVVSFGGLLLQQPAINDEMGREPATSMPGIQQPDLHTGKG